MVENRPPLFFNFRGGLLSSLIPKICSKCLKIAIFTKYQHIYFLWSFRGKKCSFDALGGVVHYYTKTPKINNAKKFTNFFSSTFNSARQSVVHHFNSEASFNKSAILTSFTFSKFGDILMGKNRQHGFQNWGLVNEYSSNSSSLYFESPSKNNNPNIQKNSEYSQIDILQKIVFTLPKEKQLLINLQFSNSSNIPRFDKLNEMIKNDLRFEIKCNCC